jgi:N-acetylmuramoyl-L-alanine amidase
LPSTYDTTASHTEAFPGNRYDAPNVIAAFSIQKRMLEYTGNEDRGVRRARFHVLREAPCAAVLLECAFLSHKPEERKLHDTAYLNRMADGLAAGIMDYLSLVKRARLMYDPMP